MKKQKWILYRGSYFRPLMKDLRNLGFAVKVRHGFVYYRPHER